MAKRYSITILDYIRQPRLYVFPGKMPLRGDLRLLKKRFNYLDRERNSLWQARENTLRVTTLRKIRSPLFKEILTTRKVAE
jgi:hypothetical protein